MAILRITKNDFETNTIVANPMRSYSSSSLGTTGSVRVYPRFSGIEKEVEPVVGFEESAKNDGDINEALRSTQEIARVVRNGTNPSLQAMFPSVLEGYLDAVDSQPLSVRRRKVLDITRYVPSYTFTKDTLKKLYVKDVLNSYHRGRYPTAHWGYTNYNTLCFFTSSTVNSDAALLYPNVDGDQIHEGYASGTYSLSGAFTFDLHLNPRFTSDRDATYRAGTILHLSSSYALSLVSGSVKDENGRAKGFRLKLQLSHSADVAPSLATPGTYPNDLIFLSDDNSLTLNHWHHVAVRWGTNQIDSGTGSFIIDGVNRGSFVVPSGTITPRTSNFNADPDVLCVGNFYEGGNEGVQSQALFFATNPATRDGLVQLVDDLGVNEHPAGFVFRHPLNAEMHDVAIRRTYLTDVELSASRVRGPQQLDDTYAFYLPPFFVQTSPLRQFVGDHGGILQTPFFEVDGTTDDPFNVAMSFGVAGHLINVENFVRDFASDLDPRCWALTASAINTTTDLHSANEFLYSSSCVRKRNLMIMPCDDGTFFPNYALLVSESARRSDDGTSSTRDKALDDLGAYDPSFISLDNLVSTSSLLFGSAFEGADGQSAADDYIDELIGFTPEDPTVPAGKGFSAYTKRVRDMVASGTYDPGVQVGAPLTIYQRTLDPSSNQMTFFNVSNLYYGKKIDPGTFTLTDGSLSGSGGRLSISLADDGHGNLYRADCVTSQSTWNNVGNIYYDEGIVVLKSPHLFFFGENGFETTFRGEQNVHVMRFDLLAQSNHLNSSSNPTFQPLSSSFLGSDANKDYVWIDNINLHDENMNVIMKAQLAQPIMKRHADRLMFRLRYDF